VFMRSLQLLGHKSGESKARSTCHMAVGQKPGRHSASESLCLGKTKKCRKGGGKAKEKRSQNGGRAQEK